MSAALRLLFGFAATASASILAALLLTRLLRSRASARSAYLTWLVVLLAVLIPFRPFGRAATVTVSPRVVQTVVQPLRPAAISVPQTIPRQSDPQSAAVNPSTALTAQTTIARRLTLTVDTVLVAVWLGGALISLALQLTRHFRYMRLVRRWRTAPQAATQTVYADVCRAMGVHRAPALYVCAAADSPMVAGLAAPSILLPDEQLNLPEQRLIFRHELTHYRRGDLAFKFLMLIAVSLHWYNPLIYLMRHGLEYACEASCDEAVMRGQDLDARAYYSETIVAVIRRQSRRRTALSTTFYGGKKGMKNRILSIMNTQRRRLGALILCPVLLVALAFSVAFAGESSLQEIQQASAVPEERLVTPAPAALGTLADLFNEEGDYLTADEAEAVAVQLFRDVRDGGTEMTKPYEVLDYSRRDVVYGTESYETAAVDLQVTYTYDGSQSTAVWRAYMTPRGGVPLMLNLVLENGAEASGYYMHPLIVRNRASETLTASLPRTAYVNNALGAAASLCWGAMDYDWPMGVCFNGLQVTVTELEYCANNVPMLTDARMIYWAKVQVGGEEDGGGAVGWIPLLTLTFADELIGEVAALPQGAVAADTATGYTSVYAGCDLSSRTLTAVPRGSAVTLLGRYADFWQVQTAEGTVGFLPLENVAVDAGVQALAEGVMPAHFSDVQPGQTVRYEEYAELLSNFYDQYGDSNEWTLEQAAQVSQFILSYPFDQELDVHILPGEEDMSEQAAYAFAWSYVSGKYDLTEEDVRSWFEALYYRPEAPETHLWRFRFNLKAGMRDCGVTFDQQGNIVRDFESSYVNREPDPDELEEREAMLQSVWFYTEHGVSKGAVTDQPDLYDRAWEAYTAAWPHAGAREDYTITAERFLDDSLGDALQWVLLRVQPNGEVGRDYFVAIVGDLLIAEDAETYADQMESEQYLKRLQELEAQLGPLYAWTVEQKAQYGAECGLPDYALPGERDISQEQAYTFARQALLDRVPMTEEEFSAYHPFFSYCMNYAGAYMWRVDFYDDAAMNGEYLDGYTVWLHPGTGAVWEFWGPGGNG